MCSPDEKPEDKDDERRFRAGKEVAEQIWREQQLTNSRMTWNLTFQSFLLAAFTVTFAQHNEAVLALLLRISVCTAGMIVALLTRASILASQKQRDFLKDIWNGLYPNPDLYAYPRPFAEFRHSVSGRLAPAKILAVLVGLWIIFFVLAIAAYWHAPTAVWFE